MTMRPLLPFIALGLLGALFGCREGAEPPEPSRVAGPERVEPGPVLRLADQAPAIRPGPAPDRIPEAITLTFPVPLAPEARSEDGAEVRLDPGGVGDLTWISPRTLEVRPREPLPPEQAITLTVDRLPTRRGMVGGGPLVHRLRTPGMALVEVRPEAAAEREATIRLDFSGPVTPSSVEDHLEVEIEGRPPARTRVVRADDPRAVLVRLRDRTLGLGPTVELRLRPGVPVIGFPDARAPEARQTVKLPPASGEAPAVQILDAHLEEGADGWLVQIVCLDPASGPPEQYYWDPTVRRSFQVSPRCVLDQTSADERVRLTGVYEPRVSGTRGGFRLLGPLPRGPVTLVLEAGARTMDGGILRKAYEKTFDVPRRTPKLAFAARGRYVPRDRLDRIPLSSLNVDVARVRVTRVRPENLVFWAAGDEEAVGPRTGDPLRVEPIALGGPTDERAHHVLDLRPHLAGDLRGLFEIAVEEVVPEGEDREPATATLRVVTTDLLLVAKRGAGEVHAWALDAHDLSPRPGTRLRLVQPSGLARAECRAGSDGGCVLGFRAANDEGVELAPPLGVVASADDDLAYLAFDEVRTPTGEADVSGAPAGGPEGPYQAATWTDRGVYRPGETAHFVSALWGEGRRAPPPGLPVELRLIDPRGTERARAVLSTRAAGVIDRDFPFDPSAPTGRYRVEVWVADRRLATETFSVEAFVPERMKASAEPTRARFGPDAPPRFRVEAAWLFGGSAEGSRVELRCRLEAARPPMPGHPDHRFGRPHLDGPETRELGSVTGELGSDGAVTLACPPPGPRARGIGTGRVRADVAVFEGASGRSTRTEADAWRFDAGVQVGLRADARRLETGSPVQIDGVVVDLDGDVLTPSEPVSLELFRVERERDWSFDPETESWTFLDHFRLSLETEATASVEGGRFSAALTAGRASGRYLVRASVGDAIGELELEGSGSSFYDWAWGETADRTPRPGDPRSVPLEAPATIARGARAEIRAQIPFAGRALFTVETDRVLHQTWREVNEGEARFAFAVDAPVPNAYVSVLVLADPHAASEASYLPARGLGVRSIRIEPDALTLPLTLRAPSTVRSRSTLELELEAPGASSEAEVLVAAVDRGILSLTGFTPPDPLGQLFAKRALGVETFETAGWSLALPAGGPDGAPGGGARPSASATMPVEPVALWSGPVRFQDGRASVAFDLPPYRGTLRVMAVAVAPDRIGRATEDVVVRDPVVVEPTVPRILTAGDRVEIPVRIENLSEAPRTVRVTLAAETAGGASAPRPETERPSAEGGAPRDGAGVDLDPPQGEVTLEPGASTTLWFALAARAPTGAARIRARGDWGDGVTEASQTVQLRPDRPRARASELLRADGPLDLAPRVEGWIPGTETTRFVLTRNPFVRNAVHLERLLAYPFGCSEQTASRLRALLYLDRLGGDPDALEGRPDRIREGIEQLVSMQTPGGGFGFWPGDDTPARWPSAYVLDVLLDLRSAGLQVPSGPLERGLRWAEEVVERRPTDASAPYLHYVLAKARRPRRAAIARALDRLDDRRLEPGPKREAEAFLLAALDWGGDRRRRDRLRALLEPRSDSGPVRRWGYGSDRRSRALEVALAVERLGPSDRARAAVEEVAGALPSAGGASTTQELAWTLTALGRFVGAEAAEPLPEATLEVDGASWPPEPGADGGARTWRVPGASERRRLELRLDPAPGSAPFLLVLSDGVRTDGSWRSGGEGLAVQRRLVDASGEPLDGNAPALGDLLYAVIRLENLGRSPVRDLALVDPFPAGLEVLNPRLAQLAAPDWLEGQPWRLDHANYLDDRAELFGTLRALEVAVVAIPLRAVTAGERQAHLPVTLEAMYDPTRWASALAPPIRVTR